MSIEQYLAVERNATTGVLTITIDRQDNAKNQINTGLIKALHSVLYPQLIEPDCRGIILRSANPKVFSTGADIDGELKDMDAYQAAHFCAAGRDVFNLLTEVPVPTVALVAGFALGGGLELSLCCDFRIAAANARLGLPEINLAIIPGWGGTQRLQRLIGLSRAKLMIMTGDPVNAATAHDYGIVDEVVEDHDSLVPAAEKLLKKLTAKSRSALALAKRALNTGGTLPLDAALKLEGQIFGLAWSTADRAEGLAAYAEKRKPKWND